MVSGTRQPDVASNCCHSATLKVLAMDQQLKLSLQKQCQTCKKQQYDLDIMEFDNQQTMGAEATSKQIDLQH